MGSSKSLRIQSPMEEHFNTITHGIGLFLSILGSVLLFTWYGTPMSAGKIFILGIFGFSLIALYLASSLYHAARDEARKRFLKYCDHAAIYVLIAGTYTPFCLLGSGASQGRLLMVAVWAMAAAGVIAKFFLVGRFRFVSTLIYLAMGWMALLQMDLLRALPQGQLNWLIAGGLSYSFGTIFYMWRRLPYNHGIWHLFVLGGSTCHYFGVLLYLGDA